MNENIHMHSSFSLNDGCITEKDAIKWAKEKNASAIFLTDHGTLMGVEAFHKALSQEGIKFIPGVEAYVNAKNDRRKRHMLLLPIDYEGYIEIGKAVTKANENIDEHGSPVMTWETVEEFFGAGSKGHGHVIATSACINGLCATDILTNDALEREASKEEAKAAKVDFDQVGYDALVSALKKATDERNRLTAQRKELKELSEKPYKKRQSYVEKIKGTEEGMRLAKELAAEMSESEDAKLKYPEVREEELKASKRCTELKTDLSKYTTKIERIEAHNNKAKEIRNNKLPESTLYALAVQRAEEAISVFGKDCFYIEIQNHGIGREAIAYPAMVDVANELGLPIIATNDAHIANGDKSSRKQRQLLRSLKYNKWNEELDGDAELYLKTDSEMKEWLLRILPKSVVDNAIAENNKFSDRFNVVFPGKDEHHYPKFKCPEGITPKEYLVALVSKGIKERFGGSWNKSTKNGPRWKAYAERVNYELEIIEKMQVIDYLLIVQDFLEYGRLLAKIDRQDPRYLADPFNKELLSTLAEGRVGFGIGAGRGSAVGSLVCYLIGITDVDPIKYGLLFERFLNPERATMPDIDSDFAPDIRGEVLKYVKHVYGEDAVCCIMTVGTQAVKAAIRNAARLYGDRVYGDASKTLPLAGKICAEVPDILNVKFSDCVDQLKGAFAENEDALAIIDDAVLVEGTMTSVGMHAAGVVIADNGNVKEYVPLMKSKEGLWLSQCDLNYVEAKGLLKMDFLGLRNLSIITDCLCDIQKNTGESINVDNISLDDKDTLNEIFAKGNTDNVFQFESDGMKNLLRKFKPENIEHLILLNALFRPGPLQYADNICNAKNNKDFKQTYLCDAVKNVLQGTFNYPVYQEEVMQIFHKGAGLSMGEADLVRKYMSKKKTEEFMKYKDRLIEGLVSNGAEKKKAEKFWEQLVEFSKYAFNKSHAAAYAITAYYTGWLKKHYPKEYLCAALNYAKFEDIEMVIADCKNNGVNVLPPEINRSRAKAITNPAKAELRMGFAGIKQVSGAAEDIVAEREKNGRFASFGDFMARTKVSKDVAEALVLSGCFDNLENGKICEKRSKLLKELGSDTDISTDSKCFTEEKKYLSVFVKGNPADGYISRNKINEYKEGTYVETVGVITNLKKKDCKNGRMCFFTLSDATGTVECACWPDKFAVYGPKLEDGLVLDIRGTVKVKNSDDGTVFKTLSISKIYQPREKPKEFVFISKHDGIGESLVKKYTVESDGIRMSRNEGDGKITKTSILLSPEIRKEPLFNTYFVMG